MSAPGRRGRGEEGYWPEAGRFHDSPQVVSGNETIPKVPTDNTPNGPGIGIVSGQWSEPVERTVSLGISAGNAQSASPFPGAVFNGNVFASTSCGIVDSLGNPVERPGPAPDLHPYLACVLEYGSGSARQKCWVDWYQGSYNLPPCTYVRVSALPWGPWWQLFALNQFNAVASVSTGRMQNAHVPTVTAVGNFAAGVSRSFSTPANARALEVLSWDSSVNTTVTISGAAAGTRNLNTGLLVPGWTPLELDLGVSGVTVTSSADAVLRLQWYLQL